MASKSLKLKNSNSLHHICRGRSIIKWLINVTYVEGTNPNLAKNSMCWENKMYSGMWPNNHLVRGCPLVWIPMRMFSFFLFNFLCLGYSYFDCKHWNCCFFNVSFNDNGFYLYKIGATLAIIVTTLLISKVMTIFTLNLYSTL